MQITPVNLHFINIIKLLATDVALFSSAPAVKMVGKSHQVDAKAPHQQSMVSISLKVNDTFFQSLYHSGDKPPQWQLQRYWSVSMAQKLQ
jgi:hypothetical protein